MAYCTVAQVRAIVDTDITDAEITGLIAEIDALMDLSLPAGLAALILQALSRRKTALQCMLKDPNSQRAGEYSESRSVTMKMLKDQIDDIELKVEGGITFVYGYEKFNESLEE